MIFPLYLDIEFVLSQTYFGLKGALGDRMFDLVTQQRKNGKLTFEDLVIAKVIFFS